MSLDRDAEQQMVEFADDLPQQRDAERDKSAENPSDQRQAEFARADVVADEAPQPHAQLGDRAAPLAADPAGLRDRVSPVGGAALGRLRLELLFLDQAQA